MNDANQLRGCAPMQTQPRNEVNVVSQDSCAVAPPSETQRATIETESATASATEAQPTPLKSAALLALGRNQARNSGATAQATGRNSGATEAVDGRIESATHGATFWRWSILSPDGTRVLVHVIPEATRAEMERRYPGAQVVPVEDVRTTRAAYMTKADETAIRAWLVRVGETDASSITDILERCRSDQGAHLYFLQRSKEAKP